MVLLGDEAQMEARFSSFGAVLVLVQDRCTVCDKCTIASEIILDTPSGTPRSRGSNGSSFRSIWIQW
jgi:hypothetical protein